MPFYLQKNRSIVMKGAVIRLIFALLLNGILPLAAADCSISSAEAVLNAEQLRNYYHQEERITRIVELAFPGIKASQKAAWRMLLLGTVAVESNFLNRYSGRSQNGNGPYQITGSTAYGVIHSYVSYPLKGTDRVIERKYLTTLFARATQGRVSWGDVVGMDVDELRSLCVYDHDFACLISLLVYKDVFARKGIDIIPFKPESLAQLWKAYYNTKHGAGTEQFFIERFIPIYAYLA